ncbi:outer membrane beta-barrel protein [Bradyrhizobium sp. 186]|uniref:outer membrane protein n=1 Tax=Bradyrhizobium sp. 186 TaxID=2782654 RepID=UPI00206F89FB|nr:outer membrane beta-barrel protein [Bradyrhizobium sp. 186]UPK40067.1 outer membrane beta-barrel protein [Bradyrhizobium sp. 186]
MLKALCGAAVVALSATAASAADLAMKAPPPAPVKFTWTGCYVGGHVGGVVSDDRTISSLGATADFSSPGFVGGGQIGCNYQFASTWLVGAEGRAAWTSLANRHGASVRFPALGNLIVPSQFGLKNDFLASATARLGCVYAERWLVYARGGAAWTREKIDDAFIAPVFVVPTDPSATVTRNGWTAGAGVEWAFAPHWSANVEYNYYDFGTHGPVLLTSPLNSVTVANLKDTIHAATIGVNYHF